MRNRLTSRAMIGCLAGLLSMAGTLSFLTACYVIAQQPEPKQASLPDGLRHVPPDALGFIHIRAGDFLKSEIGANLLKSLRLDTEAKKGLANIERDIEQQLGMKLADVDTVTFLVLGPPTLSQLQGLEMRMHQMPRRRPTYQDFKDGRKDGMRKDMFKDAPKEIFEKKDDGVFKDKRDEKKADAKRFEAISITTEAIPVSFQPGRFAQPFQEMEMHQEMHRATTEYLAMSGPLVIVTSTKALDRKKILRSSVFQAQGHGDGRGVFGDLHYEKSVLFLSDRSIMMGASWEVDRYSEQMARNPGPKARPMQAALALGGNSHVVVAGGHLPADLRRSQFFAADEFMRALVPLAPLMQAEAGMALDLGKHLDLTLVFKGATAENAEQALQAAKNLRVLAELALEKSAEEAGEAGGWKLVLEKRMKQALADAVIEQKGLSVRAQFKMELDPVLIKRYTKEIVASVGTIRTMAGRSTSINNLKQIGLALHGYHDANKRMPPAGLTAVNDPNGKPLLSWRVAILPYIDQAPLYNQFDLMQPWDHPTNKKLIPLMPAVYMVPGTENNNGLTHYRVLVGRQTMFEPNMRITLVGVTDGTSNTFMAVEAKEAIVWTRPDDLPFDPQGPLPKFGVSPDGFLALFGDATVRLIRAGTPDALVRAFITRNGGEEVILPD